MEEFISKFKKLICKADDAADIAKAAEKAADLRILLKKANVFTPDLTYALEVVKT